MVYSVVEFLNEKSVAVVPPCWFNVKKSQCAWPKKSKHIRKFLEKSEPYNTYDFDLFEARLIKNNIGTYILQIFYYQNDYILIKKCNKNGL